MKVDLILHNAHIYTVEPTYPWAEAVACAAGRLVAVGRNQDVLALAEPDTSLIDAGGRLVLPGLIDAHVHFLQYACRQQQVNLFGVRDIAEVRRRVHAAVAQAAPGQWVQGWGWDETRWSIKPTAAWLDDIAPDTPVVLSRMDMHTWWVNSVALKRANITAETPDPPQSQIDRLPNGQPAGLLREWNAIRLVEPHLPSPAMSVLQGWLQQAISQAHRLGLTAIHDQRVEREGQQSWRLWQALRRDHQLTLRVQANIAADYLPAAAELGLQAGFGDDRLWLGHVKAFADGTLGSRTASMLAPFENEPANCGLIVTSQAELTTLATQAAAAGFPMSVHAIGDRAVREVIDVLSAISAPILPHRVEHGQLIHPVDIPRLAQHDLVASVQPVHLLTDWPVADLYWGARGRYAYAFRSLLNHGTVLACGSDAPVAPLNPLLGIYAAVTRQDEAGKPPGGWYPQERLILAEAIEGYTLGAARVAGKQHLQGSIKPGKWADLVVLSHNLFARPPAEIPHVNVVMTIFAGQVVYQQDEK